MKHFIYILLIISFNSCQSNAQTTALPYSIIENLLIPVKENDLKQFKTNFILDNNELMRLYNIEREGYYTIEHIKKITSEIEKESELLFKSLKDSIQKYNISTNDVTDFEFKWFSRIRKGERLSSSSFNAIHFKKYNFKISFKLMYFSNNKWKIATNYISLEQGNSYTEASEGNDKLSFAPEDILKFGENIANLLIDKNYNDIVRKFPTEKELDIIYKYEFSKNSNRKKLYLEHLKEHKKLLKDCLMRGTTYFDFHKSISIFKDSTSLLSQYYHNRNQAFLKVKTKSNDGDKYIGMRCVILKDRIVLLRFYKEYLD